DAHLQQSMTAKSRYDVRRAFRNVERSQAFHLTDVTRETLDRDLDALLRVWDARWGKGSQRVLRIYRHMFRRAFYDGTLWLRIAWDGDEPMAVLSAFVDPVRRTLYQHIMALNSKFAKRSPGRALVGYTIRDAIKRGITTYDFLLGDEEYKYSFGAEKRHAASSVVVRRSLRASMGEILIRVRDLFTLLRRLMRRGMSACRTRLTGRGSTTAAGDTPSH
ncbi:MAG: GNAT family N-acetyltransferase, partial [Phycisphaerae bacterium]